MGGYMMAMGLGDDRRLKSHSRLYMNMMMRTESKFRYSIEKRHIMGRQRIRDISICKESRTRVSYQGPLFFVPFPATSDTSRRMDALICK